MSAPDLDGILETGLYVDDVARAADFYRRVFEFDVLFISERACGLSVAGKQVLLMFRKGGSKEPIVTERGTIPPHDGDGSLHMAYAVPAGALPAWEERLRAHGVAIEARYDWPRGGSSIYFHDPDGHLIELVTPGCWEIY